MIKKLIISFIIIILTNNFFVFSQTDFTFTKQRIGINISEIPKLGLDLTYVYSFKSYLDFKTDIGYNFNHNYAIDINEVYIPHIKCWDGINVKIQTGGFIKAGIKLNLRTNYTKNKYFSLGLNVVNSVVYEKADIPVCIECYDTNYYSEKHYIDVFGYGAQLGYNFSICNKFFVYTGMQIATTTKSYIKLYSYHNFIPGIGYKSYIDPVFPTLFFYLTYKI